MSKRAKQEFEKSELEAPAGVSVKLDGLKLTVKGPKGSVSRDFAKVPIGVAVKGNKVTLQNYGKKKFDHSILNTCSSHVSNMFKGVTQGFSYRLKVVFAHFPVTVKVEKGEVLMENFYGERAPRRAKIMGDGTKVVIEGDDLIVSGPALEDVAQTAANIELSTRVKQKDQRVFLDGIYVYQRKRPEA